MLSLLSEDEEEKPMAFASGTHSLTLRVNRIIQSSEDMILALAGQFKQLSHEPEEFFRFMRQLLKLSSKCEDHIFT